MSERGKYIVIEGPDGSGKSTQRDLVVARLCATGRDAIGVHEPGETAIGLELERIIKDRHLGRTAITNLLLFTANRNELWAQVVEPALNAGRIVVADRSWISSAVYQGIAEGLGIEEVRRITAQFMPERYMTPDLTILLATLDGSRQTRLGDRGGSDRDTFESRGDDFQRKLVGGYVTVAALDLTAVAVDSNGSKEEVHENIWREVEPVLVI